MQRKNTLLKFNSYRNAPLKRSGFAMIMAIVIIIIIATTMTLSLSLSTQTNKRTLDIYLHEQVELYAKSATELAMLYIAKNGCTDDNFNTTLNEIYTINVVMRYAYPAQAPTGCTSYFNTSSLEQGASVLMDVTVSVNNPNIVSEPIRYFRRTIQKL